MAETAHAFTYHLPLPGRSFCSQAMTCRGGARPADMQSRSCVKHDGPHCTKCGGHSRACIWARRKQTLLSSAILCCAFWAMVALSRACIKAGGALGSAGQAILLLVQSASSRFGVRTAWHQKSHGGEVMDNNAEVRWVRRRQMPASNGCRCCLQYTAKVCSAQ